jgi:ubiquinone/menaquinone biosynthesis C-methylase UbiE
MGGRIYDATWGRTFAALYDSCLAATEKAGLADRRHALLARATGSTLEIGAGTGLNLGHYPDTVAELVLAEPGEHMARRLRDHVAGAGRAAEVVDAPAERLPFPDDRFDTVVSTLVLCTVPDPRAAVAEAARVLRPGGRLLFLEHVRAPEPRLARWQDRLMRPWRFLADGCHCNRDTLATLEASPLAVEDVERGRLEKAAPLIAPLVAGAARAA